MDLRCKHYNGVALHETCAAGKLYDDVRVGRLWPCFTDELHNCSLRVWPTAEDQAAEDAAVAEALQQYFQRYHSWLCPVCGQPVQYERQVGRCAYSEPCGHRVGQAVARGRRPGSLHVVDHSEGEVAK